MSKCGKEGIWRGNGQPIWFCLTLIWRQRNKVYLLLLIKLPGNWCYHRGQQNSVSRCSTYGSTEFVPPKKKKRHTHHRQGVSEVPRNICCLTFMNIWRERWTMAIVADTSRNRVPLSSVSNAPFFPVALMHPTLAARLARPFDFGSLCGQIHLCCSLSKIVTMQQLPL